MPLLRRLFSTRRVEKRDIGADLMKIGRALVICTGFALSLTAPMLPADAESITSARLMGEKPEQVTALFKSYTTGLVFLAKVLRVHVPVNIRHILHWGVLSD